LPCRKIVRGVERPHRDAVAHLDQKVLESTAAQAVRDGAPPVVG
jgi:hypothetical protein